MSTVEQFIWVNLYSLDLNCKYISSHTAVFFWDIRIQWLSHDDLTKEIWEFCHFPEMKLYLFWPNSYNLSGGQMQTYIQRYQKSYQRWFDKRIYKTEMKFWTVLGSRGCREKKLPIAVCNLLGCFFFNFLWAKKNLIFFFKYFNIRTA